MNPGPQRSSLTQTLTLALQVGVLKRQKLAIKDRICQMEAALSAVPTPHFI